MGKLITAIASGLLLASTAVPAEAGGARHRRMVPVQIGGLLAQNRNEAAVLGFLDTAFNQRKVDEAFVKFVGPYYKQHNPIVPDGIDGAKAAFKAFLPQFPEFSFTFKRVISSGDMVVVHSHSKMTREDRGAAVIDIFRLENGKIVEHWDVNQPVPEQAANSNTMF